MSWFNHLCLIIASKIYDCEPMYFYDAMNSSNASNWMNFVIIELNSLNKNNTWILVERSKNVKVHNSRWIFKIKEGIKDVEQTRYKAKLVSQGFAQRKSIDFNKIFSLVVKFTIIRILLSLLTQFDLLVEQMDVKISFLHGNLDEKIYMLKLEGFIKNGNENLVWLLNKSLYGLK